jgi:DNA polymerase III delta subunit
LKCISDIEKLLIAHHTIDSQLIEAIIIPEFEESLFVFIDMLLQKNRKKIFSELKNLLTFSNFYAVYQGIIANLRVFLYIELLKSHKNSSQEISQGLKL